MSTHEQFQAALAKYYKSQRDRTEKCLSDIVDIVASRDHSAIIVDQIIDRLVAHYEQQ